MLNLRTILGATALLAVDSYTSSDEESDDDAPTIARQESQVGLQPPQNSACNDAPDLQRNETTKAGDDVEAVIQKFDDKTFQSHFQLTRVQFAALLTEVQPHYSVLLQSTISTEKALMASIWALCNQESYREIGERFGMSKSRFSNILHKITDIITTQCEYHISWPTGPSVNAACVKFSELGFPNSIGAIDCSYIEIDKPSRTDVQNPNDYFHRKNFFSITLMAVCDGNMKFTYAHSGGPGKFDDASIFHSSGLGQGLQLRPLDLMPHDCHLIGDSAFPLSIHLMTPYHDNGHLTLVQQEYNKRLNNARSVIERAFCLLKCRFRRLRYLPIHKIEDCVRAIKACTILHNICLENECEIQLDEDDEDPPDVVHPEEHLELCNEAWLKRDAIAESFM